MVGKICRPKVGVSSIALVMLVASFLCSTCFALPKIFLEAEYPTSQGAGFVVTSQEQFNSCGLIMKAMAELGDPTGWATYLFEVTTPGTYALWARVQSVMSGSTTFQGVNVQVDKGTIFQWSMGWPPLFASSFMDYPHGWKMANTYTFTAGTHNLTILTRMKYGTIDKFLFQDPDDSGLNYYDLGARAINIPSGKCQTAYFEAEYGDTTGLKIIASADASKEGAIYKSESTTVCTTSTASTAARYALSFADPSVYRAVWLRMLAPSTASNEVYVITTGSCEAAATLTATPSPEYQWVRLYKPLSINNEYRLYISPKEPNVYIDKIYIGYADNPEDGIDAALPTTPNTCTKNGLCDPVTKCTLVGGVPTCSACPFGYTGCGKITNVTCGTNGCTRSIPFGCYYNRGEAISAISSQLDFPTTTVTLDFWTQPMMELTEAEHTIFSYVSTLKFSEFHVRYTPSTGLHLRISGYDWYPTTPLFFSNKNLWYHIGVSVDRTNKVIKLYLNNALKHTFYYTGHLALHTPGKISLGKNLTYDQEFTWSDGSVPPFAVDELHVWSAIMGPTNFDDYFSGPISAPKPTNLKYSFSFGTSSDIFSVGVNVCPSVTTDTFDSAVTFTFRPSEAIALRNLYYSTGGKDWQASTKWLWGSPCDGSQPIWFGIDCDANGRIKTINLPYNNLAGKFPEEAANMKFFTSLTSLELLIMHSNSLEGAIPTDIGFATSATAIFLQNNELTSIPSTFSKLSKLQQLFMQNNLLAGSVPEMFSTMGKLEYLYLANNALTGSVPTSLGASNIRFMDLSNNDLSGSLPQELIDAQIYSLDLSDNLLNGVIPNRADSDDTNMIKMDFSGNTFRCMMPPFMRLDKLKFTLNVSGSIFFCPLNDASAAVVGETCESVYIYSVTPSSWNVSDGFSNVVATMNVSAVHKCSDIRVEFLGFGLVEPFEIGENYLKFYLPAAPTSVYPLRIKWVGVNYNNTYISGNVVDLTYYKLCPPNCVKPYGVCTGISGFCQCNTSWTGEDCHSKACPGQCNSHGYCNGTNGVCQCYDPYFGVSCNAARQDCKNISYCSGHGQCDIYKGTCTCMLGYWGEDCSKKSCPPYNKQPFCGHGVCNGTSGKCLCEAGWAGDGCDKPAKSCPNNCTSTSQGLCDAVTGTCICFTVDGIKWGGNNCSDIICSPPCVTGQGTCVNSTCQCMLNYQGASCNVLHVPCPNNCTGDNGVCDYRYGNCTCAHGFKGTDCSALVCPGSPECNYPHGTCNDETGICQCYNDSLGTGEYWSGQFCQYKYFQCAGSPPCSNHGYCNKQTGVCTCNYPYNVSKSADCTIADCPNDCSGHGTCFTSTGKCNCTKEYNTTADCAYLYIGCSGPCNMGYCDIRVGKCVCDLEWADSSNTSFCDFHKCAANCNGNGICHNGTCECNFGWSGETCAISNVTCPANCNSPNGYCTTAGTCFCYGNFYGDDCSQKSCYSGCSGHGLCNETTGICLCNPGFELPDCYINLCSQNNYCTSSKRGTCDILSGFCNCILPYFGSSCELSYCPNNCTGHGECNYTTGECICETGWNDPMDRTCSNVYMECPGNCYPPHGTCNHLTGNCTCAAPYELPDCQYALCFMNCSGSQGVCDRSTGNCNCSQYYSGPGCQVANLPCEPPCTEHGSCDPNTGKCICYGGYRGETCDNKTCPGVTPCSGKGICDWSTGTCNCTDPEWQGGACQVPNINCDNDCTSEEQGRCNKQTGLCFCNYPWTGSDCSLLRCPYNCRGNGFCNNQTGTCECYGRYQEPECQYMYCEYNCSNRGSCNKRTGICTCQDPEMWGGQWCETRLCPGNCSNAGHCDQRTGKCDCKVGTTGEDCGSENWWVIVVACALGSVGLVGASVAGFFVVRQIRIEQKKKVRASTSNKYASSELSVRGRGGGL